MEPLTRQAVKDWQQQQISILMEKHGVGFAFSKQQLEEYIAKQRGLGYNGKFTFMNISGMYCRSETVAQFMKDYEDLSKEAKEKMKSAVKMDDFIEYELANHECFYTGNWNDENMVNAVHQYFPNAKPKDFHRVYKKCVGKYDC